MNLDEKIEYLMERDQGQEHIRVCMASALALFKEKPDHLSDMEQA